MRKLEQFRVGEMHTDPGFSAKLRDLVDAVNMLLGLIGDDFISVLSTAGGMALKLNIEILRQRIIGSAGGTVTAGFISEVSEDTSPPTLHTYKAVENAPGTRIIDEFIAPENARDADVLYIAAAPGDACLMWWEQDDTPHILLATEIYDTVLDS